MADSSEYKRIVLSRTDNIGDVILSLPLAGYLKKHFPGTTIYFIGKSYTAPIIQSCVHIDHFLDREEILSDPGVLQGIRADVIIHLFPDKNIASAAFKAKIPVRTGTSHRIFHWLYCNKLVNLSRKNSGLHETILNFKLLQGVVPGILISLGDLPMLFGLKATIPLPEGIKKMIAGEKHKIILHPKSKGSAREWPLSHYQKLALMYAPDRYDFFITGTQQEGETIRKEAPDFFSAAHIHDLTGKLSLGELISFINTCDVLVACSTGPLHIAAALGKHAIGLYPPMKPIDPGRWAAIGKNARNLVLKKKCNDCKHSALCHCIASIGVSEVSGEIKKVYE